MNDILGNYDVYYGETLIGSLIVERDGAAYLFQCSCQYFSPDVLRLYCVSGEKTASLGVMLPEDGKLVFKKRITKNMLSDMGLSDISRCFLRGREAPEQKPEPEEKTAVIAPPESPLWLPAYDAASLFSDADIASACRDVTGALTMEDGNSQLIAIPIILGAPFPLMPVFCFGRSEIIDGNNYVVFRVRNGKLIP
ncbi:MAG: hypothetical protein AB7C97_10745 [Oscillospiraceae bacterium]